MHTPLASMHSDTFSTAPMSKVLSNLASLAYCVLPSQKRLVFISSRAMFILTELKADSWAWSWLNLPSMA